MKEKVFEHIERVNDSGLYYDYVKHSKCYDGSTDLEEKDACKKIMDEAFVKIFMEISKATNLSLKIDELMTEMNGYLPNPLD